jgi:hypothetical protein
MLITLGACASSTCGQRNAVQRYAASPADILKAGHHGAKQAAGSVSGNVRRLAIFTVRPDALLAHPPWNALRAEYPTLRTDETAIIIVPKGRLPHLSNAIEGTLNYLVFLKRESANCNPLLFEARKNISSRSGKALCGKLLPEGLSR